MSDGLESSSRIRLHHNLAADEGLYHFVEEGILKSVC